MKLRNDVAFKDLNILTGLMKSGGFKGKLGYVILVNERKLKESLQEYASVHSELIVKYGEKKDDGSYSLDVTNPKYKENFEKFVQEITPISEVEQDIDVMKVPVSEAWDYLDNSLMGELEFMLDESEFISENEK